MKRSIAHLCFFLFITTAIYAQPGTNCASAVVVGGIPYSNSNTTCGAIDDYDSMADACGSSYINGEDFVYVYTPPANITLAVDLTTDATWVGVIITQGCPDVGTCVTALTSTTANVSGSVSLTAGVTYYFTVSTWPAPDCIPNFTFNLTEMTPAANDGPCSAIPLAVGATCNYTTHTTMGASLSTVPAASCDGGVTGSDVWFTAVVPASGLMSVTTAAGSMFQGGMAIYSGPDCTNLTEVHCEWNWTMPSLQVQSIDGLAGQTVWIRFWNINTDGQGTFDICAFETPPGLEVDNTTYTPTELVEDILVTGCLEAFNVTYVGDPTAIGYFSAVGTPLGFDQGVILASGDVTNAIGPNNIGSAGSMFATAGDPDLDAICAATTNDAAILEFDFIPQDNTLEFNFIFGSEEYPEFIDGGFNDVFAFFLSGGPEGYVNQNIALIPGSGGLPVTIDNLNAGDPVGSACDFCAYYVDNGTGTTPGANTTVQYDGLTTSLTATATVTPCETYHIKIAIADAGDSSYDSGVLLEAGSFSSGDAVGVDLSDITGTNSVYEGCDYLLTFARLDSTNTTNAVTINFNVTGTATPGGDYGALPGSVTIPAGDASISMNIPTYMDGLVEGSETVIVTITNAICPCGNTTTETDTIFILDNNLQGQIDNADMSVCASQTVNLTTSIVTPSASPYSYSWDTGETTDNITVTPTATTTYNVTITDACGATTTDDVTISVEPLNITVTGTNVTCNGGADGTVSVNPTTGTPPYTYSWSPAVSTGNSATGLNAGTYDITVTDNNGCSSTDSYTVTEPAAITLTLSSTPDDCAACDGTATVDNVTNGTPGYTYSWNNGQSTNPATNLCMGTYSVTVTDNNGCTATDNVVVNGTGTVNAGFTYNGNQCLTGNSFAFTNTGDTGGGYTYDWDFGDGVGNSTLENPSYTYTTTGTYTVTQTITAGSCVDTETLTITVFDEPVPILVPTDPLCNGDCNGEILANITGGNAPYNNGWSDGQTTNPATGLCAGSYILTVTDANGCTGTASVTLSEPGPIVLTATRTNVLCNGECTGTADVVVNSGGTPGFTYLWSNGATTAAITGLCAGTYQVTVTDANGCTAVESVTVSEPAAIVLSTSFTNSTCGTANGTATVNVDSGGTPPFAYSWDAAAGSQITATATGLAASTYGVTVTDDNGCTAATTVDVTDVGGPSISIISFTDALCNGSCDGTATAQASGGTAPYTYNWSTTTIGDTDNALCAGTHFVTVTDDNNCVASVSVTIGEPTAVTATTTVVDAHCGQNDGSATVNASGGTPGYTYEWSDPASQTTQTASNLFANTYTVTVTDANSCTFTTTATVNDLVGITTINMTFTDVLCNGGADGTATATPADGVSPYTYSWDDPATQTTQTATGLATGTYFVTVTDADGCTANNSVTVSEPTVLTLSLSGTDALCNGICDGTASSTVSGGTTPYSYSWNTGANTPDITGLCAGTSYTLTVTDANGCVITETITVNEPTPVVLVMSYVDENCGQGNGSASVVASGGTPGYTYIWDDPSATTADIANGLSEGTFCVTVTDSNGCTATNCTNVGNVAPGSLTTTNTDVSCFGLCDATATVSIGGGTPPYTYLWDDPAAQTTPTATALCAGFYSVSVTDDDGCLIKDTLTITEPPLLTNLFATTDALCFGACDGTATSTPSGGTPPYYYQWSDPMNQTTATATGLCAGNFTVTITDDNGCELIESTTINEPAEIVITGTVEDAHCGLADGSIDISITNGTPPFTPTWAPSGTTEDLVDVAAGTYAVTITDSNGCTQSEAFVVNDLEGPTSSITVFTDVSCFNECDGNATVDVTGGTTPYFYVWDNGQTSAVANGFCAGLHVVDITDASGCVTSANIVITEPPQLVLNTTSTEASCYDGCDGTTTVSITGGTPIYTTIWGANTGGQTSLTATGLCADVYSVTVTDNNGCIETSSVSVTEPPFISLVVSSTSTTCFNACDGTATVTAVGGTPGYSYTWNDMGGQTTQTATGLCAGTYIVTVTDNNGCEETISVTVDSPTQLTAVIGSFADVTCNGSCDGWADVDATGGTPPYSYQWTGGSTNETATGLCAGTYNVTVYDNNNCNATTTITISQPPVLTVSLTPSDESCFSECDGSIIAVGAGGTPPYSIVWSNASSSFTNTGLCVNTYTATLTDANSCQMIENAVIDGPDPLIINVASITEAHCTMADGGATISVTGGTFPYTYSWPGGISSGNFISGVFSGTYPVTVTDLYGCTATEPVSIPDLGAPVIDNITTSDATCYGYADGAAEVFYSQVIPDPPYSIVWSSDGTGNSVNDLTAGSYTVDVIDASGCLATDNFMIEQPDLLVSSVNTSNDVLCYGDCNGAANVISTGGTAPYSWAWDNGETTQLANTLCAGNHIVVVSDANSCTSTANVVIGTPSELQITGDITDVSCFGYTDGTIQANVIEGTSPYTYYWLPTGTTSSLATGLPANETISLVVTDYNGCTMTETFVVGEPEQIVIYTSSVPVTCDADNGSVQIDSISGGTGTYTNVWSPGEHTTWVYNGIDYGTYQVQVFDGNGCSEITTETVDLIPAPDMIIINTTEPSCNGGDDGTAIANATGGAPPFTYMWTSGDATDLADGLSAGVEYFVTATDQYGCTISGSTILTQPAPVYVQTSGDNTACHGQQVYISATGSGGTPPFINYVWSTTTLGATIPVEPSETTTYYVTVTDNNYCTGTGSFTVTVLPPLNISLSATDGIICPGDETTINVTVGGGDGPPYSLYMDGSLVSIPVEVTPDATTEYIFQLEDDCSIPTGDQITIEVVPMPEVVFSADITYGCEPLTVNFNSDGSDADCSYLWEFGDSHGGSSENNPTYEYDYYGTYDVTLSLTSEEGCVTEVEIENMIDVWPVPDAGFIGLPGVVSILKPDISFYNQSSDTYLSTWDFDDGNMSNQTSPTHHYSDTGHYNIMLVIENEYGCVDTAYDEVIVQEEYTFYAPNAITVGTGRNNYFYPVGYGIDPEHFLMIIYDRWGEIVYQTDLYDPLDPKSYGWDGSIKNRNQGETGTYTWLIIYRDKAGVQHEEAGAVTVIR